MSTLGYLYRAPLPLALSLSFAQPHSCCSWVHALARKNTRDRNIELHILTPLEKGHCGEPSRVLDAAHAWGDLEEGHIEWPATECLPALSEPESLPDLQFWLYTLALLLGAVLGPSEIKIPELSE